MNQTYDEQQVFLQSLLESSSKPIFWKNIHGIIQGCNRKFLSLIKLNDDDSLRGMHESSILEYIELERNEIKLISEEILSDNKIYSCPIKIRAENTVREANISLSSLMHQSSSLIYAVIELENKNEIDDVLINENNVLKNIIAELPGYIYWKNINSEYMGCNNNLAKESGLDNPGQIIGRTDHDFYWGKTDAEIYRKQDQEVINKGIVLVAEDKIPSSSIKRHHRYIRTEKKPLYYNNKIIGVLATAVDISTEIEAAAAEIKHQQDIAKLKTNALMTQIEQLRLQASTLAHELRTPLAAIQFSAEGLKNMSTAISDPELKSGINDIYETISNEADKTNLFIDIILGNVRDFKDVPLATVSISDTIHEAVERYPYDNDAERAKVHVRDIVDFKYLGDQDLLVHVLFNLMKNALYFINQTHKGEITIWTEKAKKYNYLHFKDTSKGMTQDQQKKIFKQFFTDTGVGTGIGLYFCRKVIETFDGNISCRAKEGEYTHFIMKLPKISKE